MPPATSRWWRRPRPRRRRCARPRSSSRTSWGWTLTCQTAAVPRLPAVPIIFLSADEREAAMIAAVRAGAFAYLPKSRATADVVEAVRRAAEGEMLIPAAQLARLLARAHEMSRDEADRRRLVESLTRREMEVLALMADGLDNRAVARELGIGFTTVRGHVQNILEKLDAHSKLEALACAARYGLLDAA